MKVVTFDKLTSNTSHNSELLIVKQYHERYALLKASVERLEPNGPWPPCEVSIPLLFPCFPKLCLPAFPPMHP